MKNKKLIVLLTATLFSLQAVAGGTIKVVTTLTDLQSIAQAIGGDKVEVSSIASGYQNPHFVDPKPSYIIKLSKADLFVTIGLDLETGWSPALLNSSRNPKIQKGASGYVDASEGVPLLQVPTSTSREQGDIHIFGNPHYWLNPLNGKQIAKNIYDGLVRVSPENKAYFAKNLAHFYATLDAKEKLWESMMAPYKGAKVIVYHNEWVYFEHHFGLNIIDYLEPKPGIPPTPSQLVKVINEIKQNNIKLIITSPYFSTKSADVVARQTGAKVVVLATSVGAEDEIEDYFDLFQYNVNKIIQALK